MMVLCGAPERQAGAVPGGLGGAEARRPGGGSSRVPELCASHQSGNGAGTDTSRVPPRQPGVWAVRFPCSQQLEAWLLCEVEKPSDLR